MLAAARSIASTRLALAVVLLVAASLRVWGINEVGVNSDEAVYLGQAAAIADEPGLSDLFPVFRAHPMLVQSTLAGMFYLNLPEVTGRLFVATLGTLTVFLVFLLGRRLYNPRVGIVGALIFAVMPYHVVVSRQVLLRLNEIYEHNRKAGRPVTQAAAVKLLKDELTRARSGLQKDAIASMDSFYQAAYGLISSAKAREAFDLSKESDKLRDEYGRNTAGQRFLLARRLVESGVRMVSVNYGGWDHHSNIKGAFDGQAPNFDQAFARLITDLEERGMLKRTLVMVSSEFGRTPKINGTNGRDHWPRVFSVALAGGGVKQGYIHGASDALGGEPDRDAVGPEDLAKTMYRLLGINAEKRIVADGTRPIDIVNGGRILTEVLA